MQTVSAGPYRNDSLNKIYDLLFCDKPELFAPANKEMAVHPWDILLAATPDYQALQVIADDNGAESRVRLLANRRLAVPGQKPREKDLLGVVVEVGMEEGLDTLGAYEDGSARYINHSENIILWDTPTDQSQEMIQDLFTAAASVVRQIGPWDKERLGPPKTGDIRLSFLVADGLYFGQGPFGALANDPMAKPVIDAATALLTFLVGQK